MSTNLRELFKTVLREKDGLKVLNEYMKKESPVQRLLEIEFVDVRPGYVKATFPFIEKFSRIGGMLHGGAIMTVIDHIAGMAALTVNEGINQVTIELKINFLKPLKPENQPFVVEGIVVKPGKNTIVSEGRVWDKNGELCAVGIGTWFVIK